MQCLTLSISSVFSFNVILSILFKFWGFGKLSFSNSSTIFPSIFCFSIVSILTLCNMLFFHLLFRFSVYSVLLLLLSFHIVELHHFPQVFLSPLIVVVTANRSYESFALDHKASTLQLQTNLFLSRKFATFAYIFSHLAGLNNK